MSIVVVHLNDINNLFYTLKSIDGINDLNIEIIVKDGGTKDIHNILKNFNSKNITFKLISNSDHGIYDAMNIGIDLASKDYILFLNSGDNFISLKKIELLMADLNKIQNIDNNYDVFVWKVTVDGCFKKIKFGKFTKNTVNSVFSHQGCVVKTNILKENFFDTNYKYAADYDLFKRIYKKKFSFYYLDSVLTNVSSMGVSDKKRFSVLKEWFIINTKHGFNMTSYIKFLFLSVIIFSSVIKLKCKNIL